MLWHFDAGASFCWCQAGSLPQGRHSGAAAFSGGDLISFSEFFSSELQAAPCTAQGRQPNTQHSDHQLLTIIPQLRAFWSSTPLNFSTPSCPWLVLQAPATQGVAQDLLFESSEAQVFVWLWYYNHYGLQRGTVSNPTEVALYIENYLNGQKGKMLK